MHRAGGLCEYCRFPEIATEHSFHIDHIIAVKHRGATESRNLAWACFSCNLFKGPNIAGLDLASGELTRLFNPRTDVWSEHFAWQDCWLQGLTSIGRTTAAVLEMNHPDSVAVREALKDEGLFNPEERS